MSKNDVATRKDIDDVLFAVNNLISFVQDEATKNEASRQDIKFILTQLDSFVKRLEISDDERLVMGHQLDRLNKWTQELADKIGYKLAT